MKIPQYKTKLSMMIIFLSIILIIFSLAVTLIGTIFIAVELKNGQDVTCSEMLINLNNYFHDSDRLMKVYQVLEDCEIWTRSIPCSQYMISEDFMSRKLYLHDRGYTGNLVAYCVLVANRPGERNLAVDFGAKPEESITFDIVAVDPQWRGYGLQQRFIDWSMEVANGSGAKYIHATVNPDNNHSGQNFIKRGFTVKKTVTKYGGLTRNLLEFKVNS